MDIKILLLSTERNNCLYLEQTQQCIDSLQKEAHGIYSDQIYLSGISVSRSENSEDHDTECLVLEKKYDWVNEPEPQFEEKIIKSNDSENEEVNLHDYYKVSESLHKFIDLSCENGSSAIYILWCVQDYIPCPSEVVEFYGSMKRLHWWHNASLNIVSKKFEFIEEWLSYLPFHAVESCDEIIKSISHNLWRGSLVFSVDGKSNLTPLAQVTLQSESTSFNPFNFCGGNKTGEKVYILPTAEVFTEVDFRTIPWAFVQKDSFCFLAASPVLLKQDKESTKEVLETLTQSEEVGTLFRIRYSRTPPSLQGLQATDTDSWKQTIAEGNFDHHPHFYFQGQHETLVLLMLSKDHVNERVNCIALTDPTSYGEDIVKMVLQEELKPKVFSMEHELKIKDLLRGTLEFSRLETYALSHLFVNLPNVIRKQFLKKGNSIDNIQEKEKLRFECCSSKEILNKFITPSIPVKIHLCDSTIHPEVSVPVEHFPEFRTLEEKEKRSKSAIARCTSGDFLCGLPPPVITQKIKGMDSTQILQRCRENKSMLLVNQYKNSKWDIKPFNGENVKNIGWREALHLKYPGIYYNISEQQEKLESRCNRLREQVINETASNCTVFQVQESSSRSHSSKLKTHNEETNNRRKAFGVLNPTSQRPFFDSDSCSSRSFGVSLRRSPRKHARDAPTSNLLSGRMSRLNSKFIPSNQSRIFKPSNFTDAHKQKLRNVVLTTLETEGITMKHELFKLCFKKLFTVCKPFAVDVIGQRETTRNFEKIAKSHVKQVVHFEKRKYPKR